LESEHEFLARGLDQLGIGLSSSVHDQLLAFRDLLAHWNKVYNLTAVREPHEMIVRHLLDNLAVLPYLEGECCLDVGTGAGLPGIPLALADRDRTFTLLDSQAKRTRFLQQAVVELELSNVEVVQSRVESYRPGRLFSTVVSRAFSKLSEFVRLAGPHCGHTGVLLAMKGALDKEELLEIDQPWSIAHIHPLVIPALNLERNVIAVKRSTA